ncbi:MULTISPECIES: urease accessory protein UreF [Citrobacter]|uniref:Urease accessory protein UreF n=1 Tax=Citrobacter pasteurii TaxID=1563222 RepID=A0ABX8KCI2_9ENTR|nr:MULTISPECIES: urease accessory protein UreF [Citrobacter]QXA45703.1 urease accessory protein UreF [Citrobacter pasteurii]TKU55751.1 urease accessory protein UreF [Citrobacter sp. wls715]CEJ67416.1 Urease accessory protein UreF [Citrobacter pasteurii]
MYNTQQLRLMHLASSALPVGSFTWSQGLEWAVEIGWVKSIDDFSAWQIQQMEQNFFTVDLPLLARLYRACEQDDLTAARRWSAYLLACRETRELRDEERSRGAAFTRLVTDWEVDCSREWRTLFADSQLCGMAWLAVRWKIPLTELALSLGYSWIESAVMAGVKLVPFGQQAAQRLIIALCDRYAQGLAQALATPDASLGSATPLAAIASARHETQYSRLFRS